MTIHKTGEHYPVAATDHRGLGGCSTHDTRINFQLTPPQVARMAAYMGWEVSLLSILKIISLCWLIIFILIFPWYRYVLHRSSKFRLISKQLWIWFRSLEPSLCLVLNVYMRTSWESWPLPRRHWTQPRMLLWGRQMLTSRCIEYWLGMVKVRLLEYPIKTMSSIPLCSRIVLQRSVNPVNLECLTSYCHQLFLLAYLLTHLLIMKLWQLWSKHTIELQIIFELFNCLAHWRLSLCMSGVYVHVRRVG